MKVRIKVRPSGTYDGAPWPEVGKTIDLPDHVAESMLNAGDVEAVKRDDNVENAALSASNAETATKNTGRRARKG